MVLTPQGDVQQAAVLETILLLLVCYPTILWGNIIHLSYPPVVRIDHSCTVSYPPVVRLEHSFILTS